MSLSLRTRRPAALAFTAAILFAAVGLSSRGAEAAQNAPVPPADSPQFYTRQVQPIFAANCYKCHGGMNHRGGLHLDSRAGILRGGKDGAVIAPGHPEWSLLITLIRHEKPNDDPKPMPPKGKLSDADIAMVARWIQAGAVMPPDQPQ